MTVAEAVEGADYVAVLLPDEIHRDTFAREIAPHLAPGAALVFAHGFSVAFGFVEGPNTNDVLLVAPKAQGHYLRKAFRGPDRVSRVSSRVEKDASGAALEKRSLVRGSPSGASARERSRRRFATKR